MNTGQHHSEQTKELLRYKRKLQFMAQGTNKGCFPKGHVPHNVGKPALGGHSTRFTKGESHSGDKNPSWLGGQQVMSHDCVHLSLRNGKRIRKPKFVWEMVHGELPSGMVIYHKDGNKYNDNINNLEAITRAELLKRNRGEEL